jgi:hypothetical protein
MNRNILLVIILLVITACSSSAATPSFGETGLKTAVAGTLQALAHQPENTLPPPTTTGEAMPTLPLQPAASAGATGSQGATPTADPTTSVAPPGTAPIPVQFEVNGVYKDIIVESIPAGGSRIYSVRAMQGQIMSISAWRLDGSTTYIPQLQIRAADGAILCPTEDRQCLFWRGALPGAQDYFITFTAEPDFEAAGFLMRVAVDPPGKDRQLFEYYNPSTGISLTYSDEFAPTSALLDGYISSGNYKIQPELILHLVDTQAFENTNLSAVYLTLGSSQDAGAVETCLEPHPSGPPEQEAGVKTVGGYEFLHSQSGGAAAGHIGEQEIYRMARGNTCYEIIYHIHSVNIGNYSNGTMIEFERSAVISDLEEIFNSLTFDR